MVNSAITIDCYNLSSFCDNWLAAVCKEFADQLKTNYPQLPVPHFDTLPADLQSGLPEYLIEMLPGAVRDGCYRQYEERFIFVLCTGKEEFAKRFQQHNELAHWGVAIQTAFAIAWEPNKFLIWHELLHLMNAKDCYNKFGINKCPNPRCIMRRAPCRDNCGGQLTLCPKNTRRLERFAIQYATIAEMNNAGN